MAKKDKKNKKNGNIIDVESQMSTLQAIDDLVFGEGEGSLQMDMKRDDDVTDMGEKEFSQSIFNVLQQKKKARQETVSKPEPEVEPDPAEETRKVDVSDIIGKDTDDSGMKEYFEELDARLKEESESQDEDPYGDIPDPEDEGEGDDEEDEEPVYDGSDSNESLKMYQIKITTTNDDTFKVVKFDDGLRTVSIDLNTLSQDTFELPHEEDLNPTLIALMRLEEVIRNFYPSAMITRDRLDSHMRHVVEFDSGNYYFYEYSDDTNNFVHCYYIDDKSMDNFISLVDELDINGCLVSFLNVLYYSTMCEGFSFSNVSPNYMYQVMLTESMSESSKVFMEQLMNDPDMEIDENHFNNHAGEVISISPYKFIDARVDNILEPNSEEENRDFELSGSGEDDDEDEGIHEQIIPSEVVSVDCQESDEPEHVSDSDGNSDRTVEETAADEGNHLFDGVEDAEDDGDEDPEELERQYYASKGKKPPQDKVAPKKKADDDDDSKWIIARR